MFFSKYIYSKKINKRLIFKKMTDLYILNVKYGQADTKISTTQEANYAINIVAQSIQPVRYLELSVPKYTPLSAVLYDAGTVLQLFNEDLSVQLGIANQVFTEEFLYNLLPNEKYWIKVETAETLDINHVIGYLQVINYLTVSTWFANGIQNQAITSEALTRTTNQLGEAIYTFINYELNANDLLFLATCGPALVNGELIVTCTDNTVFDNQNEAFNSPAGTAIYVQAKKTTIFTGQVKISLNGVGNSAAAETGYVHG